MKIHLLAARLSPHIRWAPGDRRATSLSLRREM